MPKMLFGSLKINFSSSSRRLVLTTTKTKQGTWTIVDDGCLDWNHNKKTSSRDAKNTQRVAKNIQNLDKPNTVLLFIIFLKS